MKANLWMVRYARKLWYSGWSHGTILSAIKHKYSVDHTQASRVLAVALAIPHLSDRC